VIDSLLAHTALASALFDLFALIESTLISASLISVLFACGIFRATAYGHALAQAPGNTKANILSVLLSFPLNLLGSHNGVICYLVSKTEIELKKDKFVAVKIKNRK
jgi:hypothetical protein